MESSDQKPETSNNKSSLMSPKAADDGRIPPVPETEGRLSVASSSSTSSFNSIVNTNDIGMEDDDEEEEEYEELKQHLPPMSPQSSSKNLISETTPSNTATIDGTIGSSSSDQLQPFTGYDSSRIPSAVFSRKPTNRMEWSVASNESLFSIHMNNSFSMGPDMMMPFEIGNEGKQPGLNDANAPRFGLPTTAEEAEGIENSNNSSISSTLKEEDHSMIRQQPSSPIIPKKDVTNHSFDITHNVQEPISPLGGVIPVSTGGTHSVGGGDRDMFNHARDSSATGTHVSRESGTSSSSFAFPLLASESGTKKRLNAGTPEQLVVATIDDRVEEKPKSGPQTPPEADATAAAAANPTNGGEKKSSWLSCFSCFTSCPFNCKMSNQAGCFAKGNNKVDKVDD